uniref:Large ribosomal subunit protein mL59 domain-containing protein n=1 Tax=Timspurckia oligopyrenoides TaxID=708627 RepID=A0A7S0ZDT8_9RHOD|mmetsp:Transcript_13779/g.24723  ORF Transcript_13779/g.24723 Transcript_13779/m.24723 type:complete len:189 (+) Transcript_13779:55-621(+)
MSGRGPGGIGGKVWKKITTNLKEVAEARSRLPPEFLPTKLASGRWKPPKYSRRQIAHLRKRFIIAGEPWPYEVPHKTVHWNIPFKGRISERKKEDKMALIERSMKAMPDLIIAYRKERLNPNRLRNPSRTDDSGKSLMYRPVEVRERTAIEEKEFVSDVKKLSRLTESLKKATIDDPSKDEKLDKPEK